MVPLTPKINVSELKNFRLPFSTTIFVRGFTKDGAFETSIGDKLKASYSIKQIPQIFQEIVQPFNDTSDPVKQLQKVL